MSAPSRSERKAAKALTSESAKKDTKASDSTLPSGAKVHEADKNSTSLKTQQIFNILSTNKHSDDTLLSIYVNKANQGRYLNEAQTFFAELEDREIIYLIESVKVVPLAKNMPADFEQKVKGWELNYNGTKPMAKLKERMDEVSKIYKRVCEAYKDDAERRITSNEISWGVFIQAAEEEMKPVVASNFLLYPMAQSLHYSKGFYMMLDFQSIMIYATRRNAFSLMCFSLALQMAPELAKLIDMDISKDLSKTITKILDPRLREGKLMLGDKLENDPYDTATLNDVTGVNYTDKMTEIAKKVKGNRALIKAAFPVDFQKALQAQDLRQSGPNSSHLKDIVRHLIYPFLVYFGKDELVKKIKNLKDVSEVWFKTYYSCYRIVKAVTVIFRRYEDSGQITPTNNAVRPKDQFNIDIGKEGF
jgi:hypothetical protein